MSSSRDLHEIELATFLEDVVAKQATLDKTLSESLAKEFFDKVEILYGGPDMRTLALYPQARAFLEDSIQDTNLDLFLRRELEVVVATLEEA